MRIISWSLQYCSEKRIWNWYKCLSKAIHVWLALSEPYIPLFFMQPRLLILPHQFRQGINERRRKIKIIVSIPIRSQIGRYASISFQRWLHIIDSHKCQVSRVCTCRYRKVCQVKPAKHEQWKDTTSHCIPCQMTGLEMQFLILDLGLSRRLPAAP